MPNNLTLTRTNTENPDFLHLVDQLDADLDARNGDFQIFHGQFNKLQNIKHTIVAYDDGEPIGCGAIKEYSANTMEVKRMFVNPNKQGRGNCYNNFKGAGSLGAGIRIRHLHSSNRDKSARGNQALRKK